LRETQANRAPRPGKAATEAERVQTITPSAVCGWGHPWRERGPFVVEARRRESGARARLSSCQWHQRGRRVAFGPLPTKLEEEGYIGVKKEFVGKRPRSTFRLLPLGKAAFAKHLKNLKSIIEAVHF
jgi:hypothetical protein